MKIFLFYLFVLINFSSFSQKIDTIFMSNSWQKLPNRDEARFYRLVEKENDLYRFQDYYINGTLQSEGYLTSLDSDFQVGYFKYYSEKGILESEGNYIENKRNGLWKHYYEDGELYTEQEYLKGKNNGKLISYFKSGKLKRKEEYKNDSLLFGICYNEEGDEIKFFPYEKMPEYTGGDEALMQFLVTNIKYPKKARKREIEGTVLVNFIVEKDGNVSNTKIVKSIDPLLDAEAIRVVKSMPRWSPGMQDGVPVKVYFDIPINFTLVD